jgi:gluconolactonase
VAISFVVLAGGCAPTQVQPRVVAELPGYSEGIVFDADGTAFTSVLERKSVFVFRGSGPPSVWYSTVEPNGHKILPDGTHLLAARGGVQHVDASGTLIEVLTPQIATPNDLTLDGDGGVYITAPAESKEDRTAMRSGVYYLDSARTLRKVAGDFCYPNGIAVRADGKSLVVNDSCNRRVFEFTISSPGVLTDRRVLAEISNPKSVPDGMTFDQAGRLYMADYGAGVIVVFGESGQVLRTYPTGLEHPSNVAFGGKSRTDLYVTGSPGSQSGPGRLVVLPLGIKGRGVGELPTSIGTR